MPRIAVNTPVTEWTYTDIEVVPDSVIIDDPLARTGFRFEDYQRAFAEAVRQFPYMEVLTDTRPAPNPMRFYRSPMWAITPERIELGYFTHVRVDPWGGGDNTLYSPDLPDYGDRVFPLMKRRGDYYLPLAWPTSKVEARA